jgi:PAS domain S-box-containing protein
VNKFGKDLYLAPFYYKDNQRVGWRENHIYKLSTGEIVAIFDDVTERKQYEQELIIAKEEAEESKERTAAMLNAIPDLVFRMDKDGFFLDFKADIKDLYNQVDKLIGRNQSDILPSELIEKINTHVSQALNTRQIQTFEYELDINENIRHFEARIAKSGTNEVTSIIRDISESKKKDLELIKAKEKAEESDRLKTSFLQNISHEIRTPLNAISGFAGIINKPGLSEEKRNSFVTIIQNSSKQLVSIVSDILTVSALETNQEKLKIDKVCINNIIVELLSIFKQQAQNQNISMYTKQQLNDKQSEIYTDKTKITQILSNLLSNALKFTHKGSIEFGYNLNAENLEFYVKDSGIGIKTEFHKKIFERFGQAEKSIEKLYGGTGLGLSISKGFVDLLGGRIWVQSELEKGSTFYFTIPYTPVNEIHINTTIQNKNQKTVLVAEDEVYNFLYIEELLIDMDIQLIHAKDGQEAVDIFKANPTINLILMDIKMPVMDGYEAAKIIKDIKPDLPIVAQTAYGLEHERAKYQGIFDDYLIKPISLIALVEKVRKYITNL